MTTPPDSPPAPPSAASAPGPALDEAVADVVPDPPDERDLRYPPDEAIPTQHLEPLDHVLLREALHGVTADVEPLIAEPLTSEPLTSPSETWIEVAPAEWEAPPTDALVEGPPEEWVVEPAEMSVEPLPGVWADQSIEQSTERSIDGDADHPVAERFECPHFRALADPAWRQRGQECTGFALAAIANYHLRTDLGPEGWDAATPEQRSSRTVSRRMLYEMAQVYDREEFVEGSTLRGALRGWSQAGVAADHAWPYDPGDEHGEIHGSLTIPRALDSAGRPGALYLRVDPHDPAAMKNALEKGFPLFASARTHAGWFDMYLPGQYAIERPDDAILGGAHAFVIYGYDERGWWLHNSWGPEWGEEGRAVLAYEDFASAAQDVWFVFRPRHLEFVEVDEVSPFDRTPDRRSDVSTSRGSSTSANDMWLHRVSIGDDGGLSTSGRFGMNPDELGTQLYLFRQRTRDWTHRRLAIFADPGYWNADDSLDALVPLCEQMMAEEIYPLFLMWDSSWLDELRGWLHAEAGTDPAAFVARDHASANEAPLADDVGFDADATWSVLSRFLVAQSAAPRIWQQVRAAARSTSRARSGASWILADRLAYNLSRASFDVHLVGHGAGDLVLTELASLIRSPIASCQLWSPITTMHRFVDTYGAMLSARDLGRLHVITLDTDAERADRTGPVTGSLLQVASDVLDVDDFDVTTAVETIDDRLRWTPEPQPMLGSHDTMSTDPRIVRRIADGSMVETTIPDGTHIDMLVDQRVWDATIDSISHAAPLTPHSSSLPPPDPSDDPARDPSVKPGSIVDPLDWVIARSKS